MTEQAEDGRYNSEFLETEIKTLKPRMLKIVRNTRTKTLRIAFLPINDCAPLIVAKEYGIFEKYGLNVELRRRPSWKDIHREMVYRELEAAHAPAALAFLAKGHVFGEGSDRRFS